MNVVHFPSCTTSQRVGGVINPWSGSEPAHHSCPGGHEEHPVPGEMSRWELLKPCLSSAEVPEHTLKFCTLLKVSPEKAALHICSYWGVLELSTDGWGRVKSQVGHPRQKKGSFPSAAQEPGARGAQQGHGQALGTSRAQGWALLSVGNN